MAILKTREIKNLHKNEIITKINDLQLELIKQKSQKQGQTNVKVKTREIKRTIARLKTRLNLLEKAEKKKPNEEEKVKNKGKKLK